MFIQVLKEKGKDWQAMQEALPSKTEDHSRMFATSMFNQLYLQLFGGSAFLRKDSHLQLKEAQAIFDILGGEEVRPPAKPAV